MKQNGSLVKTLKDDTILEVFLNTPIKSVQNTVFELSFQGKVPDVIRRAGKNSKENIAYSMAQWYPKICEYDISSKSFTFEKIKNWVRKSKQIDF